MNEQEEFFSQKHKRLLNIATWAKYLAWIALVLYIIFSASVIFQKQDSFQQRQVFVNSSENIPYYWEAVKQDSLYHLVDIGLDMSNVLLVGFVYYVVLMGVSLGATMIVETDINYRDNEGQGGDR